MSETPDLCGSLGFSGIALSICKTLANTPITGNLLYSFSQIIRPKLRFLTEGIDDVASGGIRSIIISNAILAQIPLFVSMILLMLILWYRGTITTIFVIELVVIFALILTNTIITILINRQIINETKTDLQNQINNNLQKFMNAFVNDQESLQQIK